METETKAGEVTLRTHSWLPGAYVIELAPADGVGAGRLDVLHRHLQAIVQEAYDRYGILAEPSIDTEAARYPAEVVVDEQEWTTDPTELLTQRMDRARGGRAASHAMAMAHNAGVRA